MGHKSRLEKGCLSATSRNRSSPAAVAGQTQTLRKLLTDPVDRHVVKTEERGSDGMVISPNRVN